MNDEVLSHEFDGFGNANTQLSALDVSYRSFYGGTTHGFKGFGVVPQFLWWNNPRFQGFWSGIDYLARFGNCFSIFFQGVISWLTKVKN